MSPIIKMDAEEIADLLYGSKSYANIDLGDFCILHGTDQDGQPYLVIQGNISGQGVKLDAQIAPEDLRLIST